MDPKTVLYSYLQRGRESLMWKLQDLDEYDAHRPMTATGTNVVGIVKHVASVEAGYLGDCFGRPFEQTFPWFAPDAEPNADFLATESVAEIVDLYERVASHSDATVEALDLEAKGSVPWWPAERREVSLQQILVHMIAETHRHAGHADIVRELIDGSAGYSQQDANLPDDVDWAAYRARVQGIADSFRHKVS